MSRDCSFVSVVFSFHAPQATFLPFGELKNLKWEREKCEETYGFAPSKQWAADIKMTGSQLIMTAPHP